MQVGITVLTHESMRVSQSSFSRDVLTANASAFFF
jgi:hypothetical protein